ncbi:adipocyte plasma membrane-associated protein Hemomucin-like [Ostrinia nubilalis]|uniref:adipocyte plasma membrane-associated protein Hemomucin-like n=1 Tax=Ostrinia nubilalis TaxID=29057 RepID=UPI0030826887
MGFIFGLIRKILKIFIYFAIFASLIVLIPNLPPYTTFTKIDLEPLQPFVGALAPNEILNNPEKLYLDKVLGPEAFQIYKGEVYTSVATGEIVKLSPGGHVTFVTKIGQPCTGIKEEHICGRILGFVIDEKKNQMYVADAYLGIWKVDLSTDKKELLVSPRTAIKGQYPKLFNSVALDGNGNLYWTHSTTDFDLKDGAYSLLTDPTGRLLQYNAATNHSTVLVDNIWFANGLAVSPDNQFVVVASTCSFKLQKYYINGPKKGKTEDFVVGLPGSPDNVRALPDGSGVLVGLYTVHAPHDPLLTRTLAPVPAARKLLARAQRLVELAAESLHNLYPHVLFEDIIYNIGNFKSTNAFMPKTSGLLQIDWDGNIVASYYHTQGQIHVSDAVVFGDRLYLGQPHSQNYVGSVPAPPQLKKAFAANVQQKVQEKKEVPKAEPPKAAPKPKQVDPVKVATPKPAEAKPQVVTPKPTPPPPKPTAAPVKVEKKEAPAPPKVEVKKETPKPTTAAPPRTTPKPATKTETVPTTTPKPVEKTTKAPSPTAAPAKPAQEAKPKPNVAQKSETKPPSKPAPGKTATEPPAAKPVEKNQAKPDSPKAKVETKTKPTPIIEEIPSDTIKPNKETLKVIKKEGPTEIPNPNL